MWWSSKKERQAEREERLATKLVEAIGQAFGVTLQAQAQVMKQNSDFLSSLQEISAKKAAQIMGQRGGRQTQARKRARIEARAEIRCGLCEDPLRRDVTVEMVRAHASHLVVARPETAQEAGNGNGNGM